MLKLNQISKNFGQKTALFPLDIYIDKAKTTVLIGPSGCGKSTLLRLIIGLIKPDRGNIVLDGNIFDHHNMLSIRHKMGYVIQEGGLFPHLTAYENISLLANYLKWEKYHIEKRIIELSELTQFSKDLLKQFPIQLSGGQRQRVSLMRALMLDPELLLLDEPFGGVHPELKNQLEDYLCELHRCGKTIILISHEMPSVFRICERLVVLDRGVLITEGSPDEIRADERVINAYLGGNNEA